VLSRITGSKFLRFGNYPVVFCKNETSLVTAGLSPSTFILFPEGIQTDCGYHSSNSALSVMVISTPLNPD